MGSLDKRLNKINNLIDRLIEESERNEAFLQASPWGVLVVDRKFDIVFMSHALEEMTGWDLEEIVGEHLHTLIPKEVRKIHKEHEKDYRKNPRVRHGDFPLNPEILTKDGERVPVEISLSPVELNNQEFFYASIRRRETLP